MFEGALEHADTRLSQAEAAGLIEQAYGLRGQARKLPGERDQNFEFEADTGERYVLKVGNSKEPPDVTDLQTQALLWLEAKDPALPIPRVRHTLQGEPQARWILAGGEESIGRLCSFLPGAPLHRATNSPALLAAIGSALARVDLALAAFRHPAEGHDLMWDLQHARRLRPYAETIDDPEVRRLAEAGLARFADVAAPRLASLPAQLIHNDFNPHNVLVAEDGAPLVTGILDLGDAVRAPRVNDVAVAAAYQVHDGVDPLGGVAALVGGYHRASPLEDRELDLLGPLILGRLAMGAVITSWRAKRHPDNRAYILRNLPASVAGLRQLLGLSPDEVADGMRAQLAGAPS